MLSHGGRSWGLNMRHAPLTAALATDRLVFGSGSYWAEIEGEITRAVGQDVTGILLSLSRSEEAMIISMLAMVLMMVLSISIYIMTLKATRPGAGLELVPLSLAMSLLFGLPALRNIQPDVPSIGMRGDLIPLMSAEVIVAVSIVVIAWTWILRPKSSSA
jgi:hypothetical protein